MKTIAITGDTIHLDTLSMLPGNFSMKQNGLLIDSSLYKLKEADAVVIFKRKTIEGDSIQVSYRVMPFLLSRSIQHKDFLKSIDTKSKPYNPFQSGQQKQAIDFFNMDGLSKNGSISRGINFGNNQDVVVNSNLNLQVSGRLSDNIDIVMAATDNNIPIQADGNTQQLQEFDRVFIQLSDQKSKLIAGDYQLIEKDSYFMKFNKKNQGLSFSSSFNTSPEEKDLVKSGKMNVTASAAISRGKFARNVIQGVEKNQGPYFLKGDEGEQFIIVLSGTERVYIDGQLLSRGQDNDYIIDYNTAQLIFTAKQLITKDKRIVVEFQYSDRNYSRSIYHFGDEYQKGGWKIKVNAYSEQDSKNKPLQQDLTDAQKLILVNAGDDLISAVSPSIDSIAFTSSEVLYDKKDTLVNSVIYSIYEYSTDPSKAFYRVTFSRVLNGKGNYKQISSVANGKVFQWVAPVGGIPQGDFEPVVQLISPKKKQMYTAAVEYKPSPLSIVSIETAYTKNDINTFSKKGKGNDEGYGVKFNFINSASLKRNTNSVKKQNSVMLNTKVNYEYVQQYFTQVERFRNVEFERDWSRTSTTINTDQHIAGAVIGLSKKQLGGFNYYFSSLNEGSFYNAQKHGMNASVRKKGFSLNYDGNFMSAKSTFNSDFFRQNGVVMQQIKWVNIGLKGLHERNLLRDKISDTLLNNSFEFRELTAFISNSDTTKTKFGLSYKQRGDYIANKNAVREITHAEELSANFSTTTNPFNQFSTVVTYRNMDITNQPLTALKPDQTLLARVEHNFSSKNGLISNTIFYEIGSGQEVKREFSFIEVAAGQGTHGWNDYNNDSIKQLNEFEIAAFKDQARYIKVFTPTNQTITVYSNQFSEVFTIKPSVVWSSKKGVRKFISLFSNQTAYRTDRRTGSNDAFRSYNPFLVESSDTALKAYNSSLRNTVYFNQLSPQFGADHNYQDNRSRSILTNGLETRVHTYHELRLRWNITRKISFNGSYKDGNKYHISQFFVTRNFNIKYLEAEPKINFQPNTSFRASVIYKYSEKNNASESGQQTAILNNYGLEFRYNVLQKGSFNGKFNFIRIAYNDVNNSAIAFEMLEGLKTGENITWTASYQQNIAGNLMLSINYDGRKSQGNKVIHTGGAQVRAFF